MNSYRRWRRQLSHQLHLTRSREVALLSNWLSSSPGSLFLDLGCGDGYWTARLSAAVRAGWGVDLSAAEISRAGSGHASECLRFMQGDVQSLPFAPAVFDRAVCVCSLQNFGDPIAALRELARVMVPGGLLGLSVDSLLAPSWVSEDYRQYHAVRFGTGRVFDLPRLSNDLASAGFTVLEHAGLLRSPGAAFWAMQQERLGWSVNAWFPLSIPLSHLLDYLTPSNEPGLILVILAKRGTVDH